MAEVGSAFVSVLPSARGFGSKLNSEVGGELDSSGKTLGSRFGTALKIGAAAALGGGLLAAGFVGSSIQDASDLAESQSKVGVVFGDSAGQILAASKTSATAMGLTKSAYLGATGTLGNLLTSLDIAPKKAAGMSQEMVKLAGDLASFNNTSPEEALDALQSGLTGETEPLKRFGVNMNDATLKAQALKDGLISSTTEALTPQAKALAATALIMDQTGNAQGDFARTSDGLANQQRILAAQFGDLKTSIGVGFLPIAVKAVGALNAFIPKLAAMGPAFAGIKSAVTGAFGSFGAVGATLAAFGAQVVSVAQTLGAQFSGQLLPALLGFGKAVAGAAVGLVSAFLPALRQIGGFLLANVVPAISGVINLMVRWQNVLIPLAAGVLAIVASLKLYAIVMGVVRAATAAYAAVQAALNVVLAANPIGIVVLAIAGLVAVLVVAYKRSETFRNIVNGAFSAVRAVVVAAIGAVVANFLRFRAGLIALGVQVASFVTRVRATWAALKAATSTAFNAIRAVIVAALSAVVRGVVSALNAVRSTVTRAWSSIRSATSSAWNAIKDAIASPIQAASGLVSSAAGKIKSVLSSAWSAARELTSSAWESIKTAIGDKIDGAITLVQGIPGRVTSALGNLGSTLYASGAELVQGLIDGINSKIAAVGEKMSELAGKVRGFLPGSPVKEGPLRSWNNGGAGKRLVGLLADGLSDTSPVDAAMSRLSGRVSLSAPTLQAASFAGAGVSGGSGGGGRVSLVITNWRDGTGYFEQLADGRVATDRDLQNEQGRAWR